LYREAILPRKKKPTPDYGAIIREHEEEIIEIDSLPADGPRNIPLRIRKTDFQVRRYRQMNFILSVWPELFPKHPKPEYSALQDYMGAFESDSLLEAMQYLVMAATAQHKGRGKKIKQQIDEESGNGSITNYVTKTERTRKKIFYPLAYARSLVPGKRKIIWKAAKPQEIDGIPY
jgi:hypothetical protein